MKQIKKQWTAVVMTVVLVLTNICGIMGQGVNAAAVVEGRLITVGGKTVTDTMKIADVKALFGEPKLVTSSCWGGSAYTFYGTNYSDYLYLETDAKGNIVCYGSISEGFQTNDISYGDVHDGYVRIGTVATDYDGVVYGLVGYTEYHGDAYKIFAENLVENNRSICKHAVEMWNAVSYLYGYDTPTTYDETLFDINAQLAENGSNWYEYCTNTNQDDYYQLCSSETVSFFEYEYPNPLAFARKGRNYTCKEGYAPAFIYNVTQEDVHPFIITGFINPDILADWKVISYTQEEQKLLEKVRREYMNSVEIFNAQEAYYDIEPSFDKLPLTGGKLSENAAKGAIGYLNSIRVGAGLHPLTYSEELSEAAQCKATYTVYLSQNDIENDNPHNPKQIEGISDEYYAKCQAGSGENLFMCGILSTNIIGSITYALDDSYGSGQYYARGHRHNLLDPYYQYIGVGNTIQQGCHKMSGYVDSNVDAVAWPSKGIMPVESGFSADSMMTCQFYNGYTGTENTTVTIHCLNNDKTWTIDKNNLSDGQDMNVSGGLISYKDNSMSFGVGGVYEITFSNLQDETGEEVSYTYRSIFETAYEEEGTDNTVQQLTLGCMDVTLNPGMSKRIKAVITPATATNKRISWTSADTSVATVSECGEIKAVSTGETYITATTEDGGIPAVCKVVVTKDALPVRGDVDGDQTVTLADARLALKAALKIIVLNEQEKRVADADENGTVDLADARLILKIALKII